MQTDEKASHPQNADRARNESWEENSNLHDERDGQPLKQSSVSSLTEEGMQIDERNGGTSSMTTLQQSLDSFRNRQLFIIPEILLDRNALKIHHEINLHDEMAIIRRNRHTSPNVSGEGEWIQLPNFGWKTN
jgi:hypothetical protein